jgi:hypothetical protein
LGQITIKLRANRETGKKDIVIEYESEEDMTGWEHEKRHKRILEDLVGQGVLEEGEFGEVVRVRPGVHVGDSRSEEALAEEAETEGQGA